MDVACTGAGLQTRARRKGATYPVRLEFVGGYGQSLGNGIITISHADGRNLITGGLCRATGFDALVSRQLHGNGQYSWRPRKNG
jgi:hypothetical protein